MFVEQFMAWSVISGVDQRAQAIGQLAEKYLNDAIVAEARADTEQVFTLYLNDPSPLVRAALARSLGKHENVPRTLIWSLMQDVSAVAAEIFSSSRLLTNADLLHAIKQGDCQVQTAIAGRELLTREVVRCLVECASENAILELIDNSCVVFGPGLKHDIATRLGADPSIRATLLDEVDLLPATRQMLVDRLTGSLLLLVSDKGWGGGARVLDTAHDASNRVAIEIAVESDNASMVDYVTHLRDTAQLTPALLVRAICVGNAALFEAAIALLSGASLKRVQSIVDEGRISAFKALYSRTGLPRSAYGVFTAAISAWHLNGDHDTILMDIIAQVEDNEEVDGALMALLGRMAVEAKVDKAQNYERQLLLTAA